MDAMPLIVTFDLAVKPIMFMSIAWVWRVQKGSLRPFIIMTVAYIFLSVSDYKNLDFLKSIECVYSKIIMTMEPTSFFLVFCFSAIFGLLFMGHQNQFYKATFLIFCFPFPMRSNDITSCWYFFRYTIFIY